MKKTRPSIYKYSTILFISISSFFLIHSTIADDPIRIGATMSQSGAYSTQGIAAKNGYLLCEEQINRDGGVLGRNIEFLIYDDESNSDRVIDLYEKLITDDNVDAIMGPYGSTLTEAVAPVTERHKMVQISPLAATTSIWEQGRKYLFMMLPPAELFLAGLIDMADDNDLKSVAIIMEDALFPKAAGMGAVDLARDRGMEVNLTYTYRSGRDDFLPILEVIKNSDIEVVGMAASSLNDFITVVRQMKEMDVNVKMFGTSGAVVQFRDELGELAEYAYGLSAWEPSLQNPGIPEFTEAYQARFGVEPSFHAAGGYGSCVLFAKAIETAGTLDSDALREVLLNMETQTIFGDYAVDERGYQIANKGLFIQWQDGEKVIVWPDDVATHQPRFPTPIWNKR
ncbi:MAG: amino acid ABC transporter substrate-binding protein [Balneolaceae bacterium]|nr:amino acid ABC transporter substrate-binding protein [Balneolaceae bacterium]